MKGPAVLLAGGLDSSCGAGLARDIAAAAAFGAAARLVATAVTAQDAGGGGGVRAVHPVPPGMIAAQIAAAGPVGAAKTGMLGGAAAVAALADHLPPVPLVLDPVLAASSGAPLLDGPGCDLMLARLLPRAALVTPNLPELAALCARLGGPVAAQTLLAAGAAAVLVKGGHAAGPQSVDWLHLPGAAPLPFAAARAPLRPDGDSGGHRGTGCELASGIAAGLAAGAELRAAIGAAKARVTARLQSQS